MEDLELIASEDEVIRCPLEDQAKLGKRLLRGNLMYVFTAWKNLEREGIVTILIREPTTSFYTLI